MFVNICYLESRKKQNDSIIVVLIYYSDPSHQPLTFETKNVFPTFFLKLKIDRLFKQNKFALHSTTVSRFVETKSLQGNNDFA